MRIIAPIPTPGVYQKFPKVSSYAKNFKLGITEWEQKELPRLQRYAAESDFLFSHGSDMPDSRYEFHTAGSDLERLGMAMNWRAVQAALKGEPGWFDLWRQAVACQHWGRRLAFRWHAHALAEFEAGKRGQKLRLLSFHHTGVVIGNCLSLGWTDLAIDLARRTRLAIGEGLFSDAGDAFGRRRTQHFVLRLVADWQGWPEQRRADAACAFDEPVFNALIDHWREPDPASVAPLLLAACDRHTQQCRADAASRKTFHDLHNDDYWYNPFEILSVLRLRRLAELENPVLDHPLMKTPLAALPPVTAPYADALLDGVLAQARRRFPDL